MKPLLRPAPIRPGAGRDAIRGEGLEIDPRQALVLRLRFDGSGSEYFRLWIIDTLLLLLTLGLYAPWAWQRRQHYFASRTRVEALGVLPGARIIPLGEVWSLAWGPLMAMCGLAIGLLVCLQLPGTVPVMLALAGLLRALTECMRLRFQAGLIDWGPRLGCLHYRADASMAAAVRAWLPLPLLLSFLGWLALADWDRFSAPGGEDAEAPWIDMGMAAWLLAALLFGLVAAVVTWRRARYRQTSLMIGATAFCLSLPRGSQARLSLLVGLVVLGLTAIPVSGLAYLIMTWSSEQLTSEAGRQVLRFVLPFIILLPLVGWIALISPWQLAHRQNLLWSGTATPCGAVRFSSQLRPWRYVGRHCVDWLLTLATAGFYRPFAQVRQMRSRIDALHLAMDRRILTAVASTASLASTTANGAASGLRHSFTVPKPALAALATLLIPGVLVASSFTGLSGLTRGFVSLVPPSVDQSFWAWLDRQSPSYPMTGPSKLSPSEQEGLLAFVNDGLLRAFPDGRMSAIRIVLLDGRGRYNYLAGNLINTVYLSDDFYRISQKLAGHPCTKDPRDLVLGVVAHELGHREQRAVISTLVHGAISGLATRIWMGDWALAATLVLQRQMLSFGPMQERFHRNLERDADLRSISILRAAGVSPGVMAEMYARLVPGDPDRRPWGYPGNRERARVFREAAACDFGSVIESRD